MDALEKTTSSPAHLLDKINMSWLAETSIVANIPDLTRFKVSGHLPELSLNFSDRNYREMMTMIDVAVPHFDEDTPSSSTIIERNRQDSVEQPRRKSITFSSAPLYGDEDHEYHIDDAASIKSDAKVVKSPEPDGDEEFFEAPDLKDEVRYHCCSGHAS